MSAAAYSGARCDVVYLHLLAVAGLFASMWISSGCVPTISPPMRVSLAPAMSAGIEDVDFEDHERRMPVAPAHLVGAEIRTSFEPLDLVGGDFFDAHRIDLGVGYVFVTTGTPSQRFSYHGAFFETGVRLFTLRRDEDDGHSHRFELHVAAEILARRFDAVDALGHGARLSLDYERGLGFRKVHVPASKRSAHRLWVGRVRGDIGFGASLGFALRSIGGDQALTVSLALTMRLPGVIGSAGFVP